MRYYGHWQHLPFSVENTLLDWQKEAMFGMLQVMVPHIWPERWPGGVMGFSGLMRSAMLYAFCANISNSFNHFDICNSAPPRVQIQARRLLSYSSGQLYSVDGVGICNTTSAVTTHVVPRHTTLLRSYVSRLPEPPIVNSARFACALLALPVREPQIMPAGQDVPVAWLCTYGSRMKGCPLV